MGKDKALRMWDLMRGKGVASTKLDRGISFYFLSASVSLYEYTDPFSAEGETLCWSTDGTKFAVQSGSVILVYTTVCFSPSIGSLQDPHHVICLSTAHGPSVYYDSWFSNTHRGVLQLKRQANRSSSRRSRGS